MKKILAWFVSVFKAIGKVFGSAWKAVTGFISKRPLFFIVGASVALIVAFAAIFFPLIIKSSARRGLQEPAYTESDFKRDINPQFIGSHTAGMISIETKITISFVDEIVPESALGKAADKGFVEIQPKVAGEWRWIDARTLTFNPSKPFPREVKYTVTINPKVLDGDSYKNMSTQYFSFAVKPQVYTLQSNDFSFPNPTDIVSMEFSGSIASSDFSDPADIEESFYATIDGKEIKASWEHNSRTVHSFILKGLKKTTKDQKLEIGMRGSGFTLSSESAWSYVLPARAQFRLVSIETKESPERCIIITFSDPLKANQEFRGLVTVSPERKLRFVVEGAQLKLYASDGWSDEHSLTIRQAVKNAIGDTLAEDTTRTISFSPLLPSVRFIGTGVIVPRKEGVTIPIETVNVSGVIVEIQKLYADRISQFLQVNEMSGNSEINRVGKTIWKKIVPIPFTEAYRNQKMITALDLSPLIGANDHSLYRISLSFDVRMSEYPGTELGEDELLKFPGMENLPLSEPSTQIRVLSQSFWEKYGQSSGDYRDWDEWYNNSGNPLHPSFYSNYNYYYDSENPKKQIRDARNVFVSNVGLIAQKDARNNLQVTVTSLLEAEPQRDTIITVYDYQLQTMAQARTDSRGIAQFSSVEEAFLVTAETKTGDTGFLKLSGSSGIATSSFDVAGQQVQQGVKGYIYGERGVWRPGDTIYLMFVLYDKDNNIPDDHPVTLRFFDPRGKLVSTINNTESTGSFYRFDLKTDQDAITGNYYASIQVGALTFTKEIPVESIKPNRLKINIGFKGDPAELSAEGATTLLSSEWLHGSPASNLRADVLVRFSPTKTSFKDFKEYNFDDPVRGFTGEELMVFNSDLDDNGKAEFQLDMSPSNVAPGKLTALFKTRVYEEGGNASADIFTMPYSPYASYAGISVPEADANWGWLDVDKANTVKLALVSEDGKPLSGTLEVSVYHMSWSWWWYRSDNNVADYLGSEGYKLEQSASVKAVNGKAEWPLKFPERRWGRYLIRVKDTASGHYTGRIVYMRWPGWYYSDPESGNQGAATLSFSSDKQSYKVGETAKITIPTPDRGRILVSIENNGKLLSTEWIDTNPGQTLYQIKLTPQMTPNVYVHVSMIQPHGQTVNDRPIRLFGIIPIDVVDEETRLEPLFTTADSFEPNSKATISVKEAKGREMTYTIAVVDEGLLSLTRFQTPNAWGSFFRRDASVLSTWDIYGNVAAAYGGVLEKLLAIGGGGGDEGPAEGQKANRFPPMVRFIGPFKLAKNGTASHEIDIPQYVGAVRVMVVAGNNQAFGSAEKSVPVKKPVMVYATLPRVASITEEIALPVTVFALEEDIKTVEVQVTTNDKLKVTGNARQTITFEKSGDKQLKFGLTVGNSKGIGKVEITARSGKLTVTQTIEIDVRYPNPPVTEYDSLTIAPGKTEIIKASLPGLPGSNSIVLEASRFEPINLEYRLRYLIQYPYGCIEQTTSSVFPQLYLENILDLKPHEVAEVRRNIQAGLSRLQRFMTSSGGLGYWPGDYYPDEYATVYASHFIFEAEAKGYIVPAHFKNSLLGYLKQIANRNRSKDWWRGDFVVSYALYDLALAGSADLGAMNRLRETKDLDPSALYKLAAAYALAGRSEEALRLVGNSLPEIKPYLETGYTYGSDTRDYAIVAEGLITAGEYQKALPLIIQLAKRLSQYNYWYSTQTTAYALLAYGKYIAAVTTDELFTVSYELEGQKNNIETKKPIVKQTLSFKDDGKDKTLTITNNSKNPIWIKLYKTGQKMPGTETSYSNGLGLSVRYIDRDGNTVDPSDLTQGTDIIAEFEIKNKTDRWVQQLAMSYFVPGGWEITNPRFEGWSTDPKNGFNYQDIRDDAVFTFFHLWDWQVKKLRIMLNVSYSGKFYLPAVKVEAMYDASVNASVPGMWIKVREAEE